MSESPLEKAIFELFTDIMPLRTKEIKRLAAICSGVLLAGSTHQNAIAKWIHKPISQAGRVMMLRRFLDSAIYTQETVYHPFVAKALETYREPVWHLLIDRTPLEPHVADLLMISLSFRKRAIPLGWEVLDFGSTSGTTQIALIERVKPLIPANQAIILHGDTEFGSVQMMQYILQHPHWDFMLGQTKHTYYHDGNWQWRYLGDLPVTLNQSFYLQNIFWTKTHVYGPINLFAFFKPRRNGATAKTIETRYVTTSLPIAHTLRRLGHRRWGIEPMFRDYKSSGWHIDQSALQDPDRRNKLLLLLAINYLWATIYGRWVCKSGLRKQFTAKKTTFQSFSAGSRLVDSSTQFRQIHSATFIFILLTALFLRNRRFYERKALFFLIVVYTGETCNLQQYFCIS